MEPISSGCFSPGSCRRCDREDWSWKTWLGGRRSDLHQPTKEASPAFILRLSETTWRHSRRFFLLWSSLSRERTEKGQRESGDWSERCFELAHSGVTEEIKLSWISLIWPLLPIGRASLSHVNVLQRLLIAQQLWKCCIWHFSCWVDANWLWTDINNSQRSETLNFPWSSRGYIQRYRYELFFS